MNDLQMYVGDRMVPVKDVEVTVYQRSELYPVEAVVGLSPSISPDGQHRHVSRRAIDGDRELVAMTLGGIILAPLRWVDTDEVSECTSGCDGNHEPWFVQELRCPLCELTLTPLHGQDQIRVGAGRRVRLAFAFLDAADAATEVTVRGLGETPVLVVGEVSSHSWLGKTRWHFDGEGRA